MTILPKKKERGNKSGPGGGGPGGPTGGGSSGTGLEKNDRGGVGGGGGAGGIVPEDGHGHGHHHNYHNVHSSPTRWPGLVPSSGSAEPGSSIDPSKRSAGGLGPDEAKLQLLESSSGGPGLGGGLAGGSVGGPSHGTKRRQRTYAGPRSKSKSSVSSSSLGGNTASGPAGSIMAAECGVDKSTDVQTNANATEEQLRAGAEEASADDYNSGDEYESKSNWTPEHTEQMEGHFEKCLRKKGFTIKKMGEDGACLFRAAADQVYGDQDMHGYVRKLCMDYIAKNMDYFSQYITEDFDEYIKRKRCEDSHGNHVEIQALSELFNRPIEVYHYHADPINIFQGCGGSASNEPIRFSYHRSVHYNSVVDPYKATVGVGLGLPGLKPGLADRNLVQGAIHASEQQELETAMLEDKLRVTDWEATSEAIEEQVARESYLDWLQENEKRIKSKKSKTATATNSSSQHQAATTTTITTSASSPARLSPKASSSRAVDAVNLTGKGGTTLEPVGNHLNSSGAGASSAASGSGGGATGGYHDFKLIETASFMNQLPPQVFGIGKWETPEEGDILARVLAQSQQEYLDTLKRNALEENTSGRGRTSPEDQRRSPAITDP